MLPARQLVTLLAAGENHLVDLVGALGEAR
jgi:hypothetical protein